ncbi:FeoB-associated Cys-rich membrane protein [Bittarella massiliensis]|uniref:FeoB-associated Cys-rich membrane protein n=1 Tax=Bittarella massiliensis (ex Durand et al. 2017) TaxID=1720313 RepID=UPI00163BA4DA|nr:FeoB-associated Cys-rich membrane protein [Bittarella massiliensis (ex Durand et al. 2017)]MBC2871480.1 FeoB-associated Cys-rich membrane protein [Bittarella massiliensis (ex Durand et al. 2017)]
MNGSTIVGALIVLAIVAAIVGRGIWNRRHHRGGCSCGCGDCPSRGLCHPDK